MSRVLFAVCACVFISGAASAEAPLVERFIGAWTSNGDAFGGPAQSMMTWTPALDGKFVRLEYRIETPCGGETTTFEGVAFYQRTGEGEWRAFWADNSGDLHPVRAERDGDALVSHWGVPGGKQGRTRYALTPDGKIDVTDWIRTADGWRQFNRNTFTRVEAAQ